MEEAKLSLLTDYQPNDLSSIKPSRISSEKELENEANSITELLKDISITQFYHKIYL